MTRGAWPGISNSDQFFYDFDFLIVLTVSHFPVFFFFNLNSLGSILFDNCTVSFFSGWGNEGDIFFGKD